mmetsp:Transcript_32081/g.80529  ORF Transcript_32081/g.80529 Transcript_32081/m.80529 type:complete len:366 (+) Transcript_32081:724-1821(+)
MDVIFQCRLQIPKRKKSVKSLESLYWACPEVLQGKPFHPSSDIWSLAITALELYQGAPPFFHVKNGTDLLKAITSANSPIVARHRCWSSMSPAFSDFLFRCLCLDAGSRPSAASLLQHDFIRNSSDKLPHHIVDAAFYLKSSIPRIMLEFQPSTGALALYDADDHTQKATLALAKHRHLASLYQLVKDGAKAMDGLGLVEGFKTVSRIVGEDSGSKMLCQMNQELLERNVAEVLTHCGSRDSSPAKAKAAPAPRKPAPAVPVLQAAAAPRRTLAGKRKRGDGDFRDWRCDNCGCTRLQTARVRNTTCSQCYKYKLHHHFPRPQANWIFTDRVSADWRCEICGVSVYQTTNIVKKTRCHHCYKHYK